MKDQMKIEIWSDVLCPFCYIGKRHFETALKQFEHRDNIEIIWKSYQLDPSKPENVQDTYLNYLVKRKGMTEQQVEGMLNNVTQMAKQAGLEYHLDQCIIVNSMKAHQLIQYAKTKGLGDAAEEQLFRAFFIEGKNIADLETLKQLATEIGLDATEVDQAFTDQKYHALVQQDIQEAQQIGVQGVPFFVLDRKYAISGAQPPEAFLENLNLAFAEWQEKNSVSGLKTSQGQSCDVDGNCD